MKSLKTLGAVALLSTSMLGAATSFAAVDKGTTPSPDTAQTPVNAKFKLPDDGGKNENPSNPGNGDNQNKPLNPAGPFGIAYVPAQFKTTDYDNGGVALQESGNQKVAFTNTDARVGVKDKTRTPGGWTLSASLAWNDGKVIPGATIQFTQGQVQINKNDGKQYDSTSDVTAGGSTTINDSATPIMNAATLSDGKFYDAVYDDDLQNPTLDIPDASAVQAGDYAGTVTWKLTAAEA